MADFARLDRPRGPGAARPAGDRRSRRRPARARAHHRACSTGSATAGSPAAGVPCRRDQRQGLDLRLPARRARSRGPPRPCLHQPAPGPLQRAHPHRRAADRRRDARAAARPKCSTPPTASSRASSRSPPPPPSSPSRAPRPTPASSKSGSAAGSTRPTSSTGPLVCGIASLGLDHQHSLGDTLVEHRREKAGIAKPGVPLVTQLYPPAIAARIGEVAAEAGAIWLPRGGRWDAIVRQGQLHYRDAQGELDAAAAAPARRASGAQRRPRRRHAPPPGLLDVPPSALARGDGLDRLAGAAAAARPRPAARPAPGGSELWLDGGHNPDAARRRRLLPQAIGTTAAAAPVVRQPQDQGRRRHARARSRGIAARRPDPRRSPATTAAIPPSLRPWRARMGFTASAAPEPRPTRSARSRARAAC